MWATMYNERSSLKFCYERLADKCHSSLHSNIPWYHLKRKGIAFRWLVLSAIRCTIQRSNRDNLIARLCVFTCQSGLCSNQRQCLYFAHGFHIPHSGSSTKKKVSCTTQRPCECSRQGKEEATLRLACWRRCLMRHTTLWLVMDVSVD